MTGESVQLEAFSNHPGLIASLHPRVSRVSIACSHLCVWRGRRGGWYQVKGPRKGRSG